MELKVLIKALDRAIRSNDQRRVAYRLDMIDKYMARRGKVLNSDFVRLLVR